MDEKKSANAFLEKAGWGEAIKETMAGDFSTRAFTRLRHNGKSAILMEAAKDQKTDKFVLIDGILRGAGLSPPEIYAADIPAGLVLMEDFGFGTMGDRVAGGADPMPFYEAGTDVLIALHERLKPEFLPEKELPLFDARFFADFVTLRHIDLYFPYKRGRAATSGEREGFTAAWLEVLAFVDDMPRTLVLRDYMLENLMPLPEREGAARAGIIDFQDAAIGPVAYDLASLCEHCRRVPPREILDFVLERYAKARQGVDRVELKRAASVLLAQRHARTLGNFTRFQRFDVVARVEAALMTALGEEESLAPVARWFEKL
jgi:hypothetical protein